METELEMEKDGLKWMDRNDNAFLSLRPRDFELGVVLGHIFITVIIINASVHFRDILINRCSLKIKYKY